MTEKYIMITKEKFDDIKTEYDKLHGELSTRLVSIVGLLTGYDLDTENECLDWDCISKDDRKKIGLEKARELMTFLDTVEEICEWDVKPVTMISKSEEY